MESFNASRFRDMFSIVLIAVRCCQWRRARVIASPRWRLAKLQLHGLEKVGRSFFVSLCHLQQAPTSRYVPSAVRRMFLTITVEGPDFLNGRHHGPVINQKNSGRAAECSQAIGRSATELQLAKWAEQRAKFAVGTAPTT